VDGVATVNPGQPAEVLVSFDGTNVHFSFAIPQGEGGATGATGGTGSDGGPGPQGPPFAQAVVDATETLAPGTPAAVSVSFDGSLVHFTFGIPRGADGAPGVDGAPGEVSAAQLASAIDGTSATTDAVGTLDTPFSDPDDEALRQKLNELILAARRSP